MYTARREVRGHGHREHPAEDRRRVDPTVPWIAGLAPGGHTARGDRPRDGAETEGHEHRRHCERDAEVPLARRTRHLFAEREARPPQHDPQRGDAQRNEQREGDRSERLGEGGPAAPPGRRSARRGSASEIVPIARRSEVARALPRAALLAARAEAGAEVGTARGSRRPNHGPSSRAAATTALNLVLLDDAWASGPGDRGPREAEPKRRRIARSTLQERNRYRRLAIHHGHRPEQADTLPEWVTASGVSKQAGMTQGRRPTSATSKPASSETIATSPASELARRNELGLAGRSRRRQTRRSPEPGRQGQQRPKPAPTPPRLKGGRRHGVRPSRRRGRTATPGLRRASSDPEE